MKRISKKMSVGAKIEFLSELFTEHFNQEVLDETHEDLCKDLTFAFLFERKFEKQSTGNNKIPYKLVTEGKVFNIEDYEFVKDFESNFTGNLEWDEESKNFETYGDLLFNHTSESIDEKIRMEYNKKMGANAYELLLIEASENEEHLKEINGKFNNLIHNIWLRFSTMKYAEVIDKYRDFIYQEEFEIAKERDTELEKQGTEAFLYQEIIEEIKEDYNIDLMEYEVVTENDKDVLEVLNEWAKDTTFNKIELLEFGLPKQNLDDYKWLDKNILEKKIKDFKETVERVDGFFAGLGIPVVEKKVSYQTTKLYSLMNAIFSVKGEKIVSIYGNDTTKTYCFDEYNRVLKITGFNSNDSVIEMHDSFLNDLSFQLVQFGTVVVKSLISKEAVKKDREIIEVSTYELRTAYLISGLYTGLKKEDAAKFLFFVQDTQTKYEMVDWEIGNRNVQFHISENEGEEDEED